MSQGPILGPYASRGPIGPLQGPIPRPYASRGPIGPPYRTLSYGSMPLGALMGPCRAISQGPTPLGCQVTGPGKVITAFCFFVSPPGDGLSCSMSHPQISMYTHICG